MTRRGLLLSAGLHLAVFFLVLLGPAPPDFEWEPTDAIAVDLVSPISVPEPPKDLAARQLPEREPDPLPPPVAEPEPEPRPEPEVQTTPEPPPEPAPAVTKPRKPPRQIRRVAPRREEDEGPTLAERLRARLDPAEASETTPDEPVLETQPAAALAAATSSAEVDAQDFPFAWYLNVIRTRVTDAWDPPGDRLVVGRSNRVLVRLRIHRDGRVSEVRVEGSGNASLDASAERAVKAAQPFPPLPESWEGDVLDAGIRFTVEAGS